MTIVKKLNFQRKKGMLYHIDKEGNLVERKPRSKVKTVVVRSRITKQRGYFYFPDKQGNISKAEMHTTENDKKWMSNQKLTDVY